MKIIKGDIIAMAQRGEFDVLVHGCNCFNNMNIGFSKKVKDAFPVASIIDSRTGYGKKNKLGNYSGCLVDLREFDYRNRKKIYIINAYVQYTLGNGAQLDYSSLKKVFQKIKKDLSGFKIAFPLFGYGLSNTSNTTVFEIIEKELAGEDFSLIIDAI